MYLSSLLSNFQDNIVDNWVSGGFMMIFLFGLALLIFVISFELLATLRKNSITDKNKDKWLDWAKDPEQASGNDGIVLRYTRPNKGTADDVRRRFAELREIYLGNVERQSTFLKSLVGAAPLMGLLGTVIGMLTTFQGIATSGGNQTVDMVSKGISTALITTQTGLMIALPGLFLSMIIRRKTRSTEDALNRMEGMILGNRKD